MPQHTDILFYLLLRTLPIARICDVGSKDGAQALVFRRVAPSAAIQAFEANPDHAASMARDPALASARIEVTHVGVSDRAGTARIHVVAVNDGEEWADGASSLKPRTDGTHFDLGVVVPTRRLEDLVDADQVPGRTLALWIDTEGLSYEVLAGVGRLADRLSLVHVEVEAHPFWAGQHLEDDVLLLAAELGLVEIARGSIQVQHDVVLMHREVLRRFRIRVFLVRAAAALGGRFRSGSGVSHRLARVFRLAVLRKDRGTASP